MRTNFQFENQNITMVRGDTLAFNTEIRDDDGNVVTVDSADFSCKKRLLDEERIFHKTLGNGISQGNGYVSVRVAPEDTQEIEAGRYFYDYQIGIGEDRYTLMKGVLTIEQDVSF